MLAIDYYSTNTKGNGYESCYDYVDTHATDGWTYHKKSFQCRNIIPNLQSRRGFRVVLVLVLTASRLLFNLNRPHRGPDPISFQTAEAEHIETVKCGNSKCFATFSGRPLQSIGYIVSQENRTRFVDIGTKFEKAWMIASHIKSVYNVSSLILGPPETVLKGSDFVKNLNEKREYPFVPYQNQRFSAKIPLIVQKSLIIPEPNMWWHYIASEKKGKLHNKNLYLTFLQDHVRDLRSFAHTLYDDLVSCKRMLDLYPCLCVDYQFIIDNEGHVHHLDVDRCFDNDNLDTNAVERTRAHIKSFLDTLIENYMNAVNDASDIRGTYDPL